MMTIPPDPMVKAEAHFRGDELVPRHATEMPFADVTGCVSVFSKDFSDTGFGQREWQIVGDGFVVQRIFPRHKASTRRHTYRDVSEGVRKKHPLLCELIHRWRLHVWVACTSNIALPMLVTENKD